MDARYFFDESVTGKLAASLPWQNHLLGLPEHWPVSLKTILGMLFRNPHPMFLFWGEESICFYNDSYLPSFGVGKHPKAMGQKGVECWEEIWAIIGPQIEQVMTKGVGTWNVNHLVPIFRNGQIEEVYWTYSYSPVLDESGAVVACLVTCTETTQEVFLARRLEQSEKDALGVKDDIYALFRQAPFPLALLSGPGHRFKYANKIYESYFLKDKNYIGETVADVLPEAKDQGFIQLLDSVYESGERFVGSEVKFSLADSDGVVKIHYLNFVYEPIRSKAGKVEGILAVIVDVTSFVLARNARDEFLSIASHELKTPLTSLTLQAQMYQRLIHANDESAFDRDRVTRYANQNIVSILRLNKLVDTMLDLSRIRLGKLSIEKTRGDLTAVVKSVITDLEVQFQEAKIELPEVVGDDMVLASFDPFRIEQVIMNLLLNSIRYGNGSKVTVEVLDHENTVEFKVSDHGPGVPVEARERIFDPYERSKDVTNVSGFGLGLFISKEIVDSHAGRIYVDGRSGRGAIFVVELPK